MGEGAEGIHPWSSAVLQSIQTMAEDPKQQPPISAGAFGTELAPALIEATDGRLSDLRFFQADWQRGGASTAYGKYQYDDGSSRDVMVKVPVGPVEHRFTTELAKSGAPTPGVAASGDELGGYDLAWLILERIPGDPISRNLAKENVFELVDATVRFYHCAQETFGPPANSPTQVDWARLIEKARQSVRDNSLPSEQKWSKALKHMHRSLDSIVAKWHSRPIDTWRHGDLHPGNAMRRPAGSVWGDEGVVLIDLAEVAPGNWITDAVYLERVYWGNPELLFKLKPVALFAKARKQIGLHTGDNYHELAAIRRALMAACVPAFLDREGQPRHLAGALEALQKSLAQL